MTRRGNGEGSYREVTKNGVKYIEGRIRINGKHYQRYAQTIKACREKIDKLKFNGAPVKLSSITLKQHLENWLENEVALNRSEGTYDNYKIVCNVHLIPDLGHYKIVDLNRSIIQAYVKNKSSHVITFKNSTRKISARYIELIKVVLGASLKSAIKDGIIEKNPTQEIVLPKKRQKNTSNNTNTFLLKEEIDEIFNTDTTDNALEALNKFILMYGLRRGEGRIVKWVDIDLKNKTFLAHGTKTKKAKRILPLYDLAITFLKEWKAKQNEYILALGSSYNNQGYVFANEQGEPFHPDSVRNGLKRLLKKSNINKKITVHGLRHSMATYLLGIGIAMEIVQQILGHESIDTTIDTYAHIHLGLKRNAADIFNKNVGKNVGKK